MRRLLGLGLLVVLAVPSPALAWGAVSHRYITAQAITLLPPEIRPFFERSKDELVLRSNDPDLWRVVGFDDEPPNHQIDFGVDDYGAYPFTVLPRDLGAAIQKFGVATVRRHGLLPWRTTEEYGNLVRVFQAIERRQLYADQNAILFAAALGHYIEDGTQPLHVHNNFDGQLTGQNGLHNRFEAELFERFETRLRLTPQPIVPTTDPSALIWGIALDAYQQVPKILEADKAASAGKDTYDDEYFERFFTSIRPVLEEQLSRAISATASAITGAWEQAGKPVLRAVPRPVGKVRSR